MPPIRLSFRDILLAAIFLATVQILLDFGLTGVEVLAWDAHDASVQLSHMDSRATVSSRNQSACSNDARGGNCTPNNCTCDPMGSKSLICDKLTRRCACEPGYTGPRCDRCSLGFHRVNLQAINTSDSNSSGGVGPLVATNTSHRGYPCQSCGECFDWWHQRVRSLKDKGIESIKRTNELNHLLTSSFTVKLDALGTKEMLEQNSTTTTESLLGRVTFDELSDRINSIGERVLTNKQISDLMNILSLELNSTMINLNTIEDGLKARDLDYLKLEHAQRGLDYKLHLQDTILDRLERSVIEPYRQEQLEIQANIPRGAWKLLQANHARSLRTFQDVQKLRDVFNHDFNDLIDHDYPKKLDQVKKSQNQLDNIGLRILKELLMAHSMKGSDFEQYNLTQTLLTNDKAAKHPSTITKEKARLLMDQSIQKMDAYQTNYENRSIDLQMAIRQIEGGRELINEVNSKLDALAQNSTQTTKLIESIKPKSDTAIFGDLVHGLSQQIKDDLDKVESRLSLGQTELHELNQINLDRSHNNSLVQVMDNLANETMELMRRNDQQLSLLYQNQTRDDLLEAGGFKSRTDKIINELQHLGEEMARVVNLSHDSDIIMSHAMKVGARNDQDLSEVVALISDLEIDHMKLMNDSTLSLNLTRAVRDIPLRHNHDLQSLINLSRNEHQIQNGNSTLFGRIRLAQMNSFKHQVELAQSIEQQVDDLHRINLENTKLSIELGDRSKEASIYVKALNQERYNASISQNQSGLYHNKMDETKRVATRDRYELLYNHRLAVKIIDEFENISEKLYSGLSETRDLVNEFESNKITFLQQQEVISSLHAEIDQINYDISEKLKTLSKCN